MPRLKKRIAYQGLDKYTVYKEDTDNSIFNVKNVPDIFTLGKGYFLILGSLQLKQQSDVLVEILDSEGNTVYYEIPRYLEATGRAVSVWVFSSTARGPATVTILGELEDVPKEWKGKYNVKKTFTVVMNPLLDNSEPIRFETAPILSSSVYDKAYLFVTESITSLQTFTSGFYQAVGAYNPTKQKYVVNLWTLAVPPAAPPTFKNGTVHLSNLTVDGVDFTSSYTGSYTMIDGEHFYIDPPPYVYEPLEIKNGKYWIIYGADLDRSKPRYVYNFDSTTNWSLHYQVEDTGSRTEFTSSFAKLVINKLQSFSGKVDSVKVFKKSITDINYSLLGEFPADPLELFVSRSNSVDSFPGIFDSQTWVAQNWTTSSISGGPTLDKHYLQQSDLNIYDSILMSQSVARPESFKVYPKNTQIQFYEDSEYSIYVDVAGQVDSTTGNTIEMNVYMSGSAFYHTVLDDQLGKKVANIYTTRPFTNFGQQLFNFVADKTGTGTIVFEIIAGKWNVANISIKHAADEGYNPDDLTIYVPLDNIKRNEISNFRVEFLNSKKEAANKITETSVPILLKNNPVYIELADNVVTGSLSIGHSANTGLVLAGNDAPTIRSIGYSGFSNTITNGPGGFAFYSGSPEELSQSFQGQDYQGVGFELQTEMGASGSLAFRYNPANPTGSYLIITASIYALSGSNVTLATGSGGGGGGTGGLWTASVDGTYISRLSDAKLSGSLYLSRSLFDASGSSGSDSQFLISDPNGSVKWSSFTLTGSSGFASASFTSSVTWSFDHNLAFQYPAFQIFTSSTAEVIIPQKIVTVNENLAQIYFTTPASGTVIATFGGVAYPQTVKVSNFIGIAVSAESSPITSSAAQVAMYMPHDFTLEDIRASVSNTGSADLTFDVLKNGTTLLGGNYITISGSTYTGSMFDINTPLYTNDRIFIQTITDGSGSTGLKVYLVGSGSISSMTTASYAVSTSYALTSSYYFGGIGGYWTGSADGSISRLSDVKITGSLLVTGSFEVTGSGATSYIRDALQISGSLDATGSVIIKGGSDQYDEPFIIKNDYGSSMFRVINGWDPLGIYAWTIKPASWLVIGAEYYSGLNAVNRIDIISNNGTFIQGPLYPAGNVMMGRTGDATGVGDQKGSYEVQFQGSTFNQVPYYITDAISMKASTTVTESHRFVISLQRTGSEGQTDRFSIWNTNGKAELTGSLEVSAGITGSFYDVNKPIVFAYACADETTPMTASDGVATFYMPWALQVTSVKASLTSTGSAGSASIDIRKNGSNIFLSPLIISASVYTGSLVPVSKSFAEDDRITIDLKTVGTGLTGLKIYILGH